MPSKHQASRAMQGLASLHGQCFATNVELDPVCMAEFAEVIEHLNQSTVSPMWALAMMTREFWAGNLFIELEQEELFPLQLEQRLDMMSPLCVGQRYTISTKITYRPGHASPLGYLRADSSTSNAQDKVVSHTRSGVLLCSILQGGIGRAPLALHTEGCQETCLGRPLWLTRERIAAYSTVTGDRNPIHKPGPLLDKLGLEDVPAQGLLLLGLSLSRIAGSTGAITKFKCLARFPSVAFAGDRLRFLWRATGRDGRLRIVTQRATVMNLWLTR